MTDIEIPFEQDRHARYRFFEILPGALSWLILALPFILAFINVTVAVFFILAYLLIYFTRTFGYDFRAVSGYRTMKQHMRLNWNGLLADVEAGEPTDAKLERPKWHYQNLERRQGFPAVIKPSELTHAVIVATVNESK